MAPVFVLPLKELDVEGEDVFWGVWVVWPLVEVGTILEALPVTSGESPASCAAPTLQVLLAVGSRYAQRGIRVPAGMGSETVPGGETEVQLKIHSE